MDWWYAITVYNKQTCYAIGLGDKEILYTKTNTEDERALAETIVFLLNRQKEALTP
jgi:hypothetical protein